MSVFVISSQTLFRSGLDSLLRQEAQFEVLGQADNVDQASEQIKKLQPDVIILDDTIPSKDNTSDALRVLQIIPHAKVIGLNLRDNQLYIYQASRMIVKSVKDLLEVIEPSSPFSNK